MILETDRLLLREWGKGDVDDIVNGLSNIDISKWLAFVPYPYSIEDAEQWINYCIRQAGMGKERTSYEFAIELKSENKVIGGTSIDRINKRNGTSGGGGIWISAAYHGHGYGTEAFGARIAFAFNVLNLRRLENGFFDGNRASWKMQEKFGYKLEGTKRQAYRCMADGELKDEHITGLLRDEWNQVNLPLGIHNDR